VNVCILVFCIGWFFGLLVEDVVLIVSFRLHSDLMLAIWDNRFRMLFQMYSIGFRSGE